jgi:hypothetical protein
VVFIVQSRPAFKSRVINRAIDSKFLAKKRFSVILRSNFNAMVSISTARQLALSLPEAEEHSHFSLPDFRVKKKIFASLHEDKGYVMVKLSLTDQSVFCSFDKETIFPVPGGWGRQGATFVNLKKVKKSMLLDALTTAWKNVAPPKMVAKYFPGDKE